MRAKSSVEPDIAPTPTKKNWGPVCRQQLARLLRLVMILQAERYPNARELAERCEVSRRTIYRDLDLLALAGAPASYRQDRQGYHLAGSFFLPPLNVSADEVLALQVLARSAGAGHALGLARPALEGADKLAQGLHETLRERVAAVAGVVESIGPPPPPHPGAACPRVLLDAIAGRFQVRLSYAEAGDGAEVCTRFSPYRLLWHEGAWALIGRSTWHRRVVAVRLDSVTRLIPTDEPYTIPTRFRPQRYLGSLSSGRPNQT